MQCYVVIASFHQRLLYVLPIIDQYISLYNVLDISRYRNYERKACLLSNGLFIPNKNHVTLGILGIMGFTQSPKSGYFPKLCNILLSLSEFVMRKGTVRWDVYDQKSRLLLDQGW